MMGAILREWCRLADAGSEQIVVNGGAVEPLTSRQRTVVVAIALAMALTGAALLLRDDRRRGTYIAGCIFFAATMLVRAQNVLLAWPWIVASWRRVRARRAGEMIAGTALIVVLVLTGYGIAAKLTGFDSYFFATKWHQRYVATVDGSLNPARTPMRFLLQ